MCEAEGSIAQTQTLMLESQPHTCDDLLDHQHLFVSVHLSDRITVREHRSFAPEHSFWSLRTDQKPNCMKLQLVRNACLYAHTIKQAETMRKYAWGRRSS